MEKPKQTSFRINIDKEDVDFMNDYKEEFGSSIQWFVEKAVKMRIAELKVKRELNEEPYTIKED